MGDGTSESGANGKREEIFKYRFATALSQLLISCSAWVYGTVVVSAGVTVRSELGPHYLATASYRLYDWDGPHQCSYTYSY